MKIEDIKKMLVEMNLNPKRALGQNFLINDAVIDKIIGLSTVLNPSSIIEVGPGLGALTQKLIAIGKPLKLIELDDEISKFWTETLSDEILVKNADALKINWETLVENEKTLLVSNLPYQISTSIVVDRTIGPVEIENMILMFQREVADRIMSPLKRKSYGMLSVFAQTFWEISKLVDASPGSFYPRPKINSQVLFFRRKEVSPIENKKQYLSFLKMAFAHRRKILKKNFFSIK